MKAILKTQGGKYIAIGIATAIVEYTSFTLLMAVNLESSIKLNAAQTISFTLAMIVNFYGNRSITFGGKSAMFTHSQRQQATRYFFLAITNLIISNIVITILVNTLGIPALLAKLLTMIIIVAWTYITFQKIVFKRLGSNDN